MINWLATRLGQMEPDERDGLRALFEGDAGAS